MTDNKLINPIDVVISSNEILQSCGVPFENLVRHLEMGF